MIHRGVAVPPVTPKASRGVERGPSGRNIMDLPPSAAGGTAPDILSVVRARRGHLLFKLLSSQPLCPALRGRRDAAIVLACAPAFQRPACCHASAPSPPQHSPARRRGPTPPNAGVVRSARRRATAIAIARTPRRAAPVIVDRRQRPSWSTPPASAPSAPCPPQCPASRRRGRPPRNARRGPPRRPSRRRPIRTRCRAAVVIVHRLQRPARSTPPVAAPSARGSPACARSHRLGASPRNAAAVRAAARRTAAVIVRRVQAPPWSTPPATRRRRGLVRTLCPTATVIVERPRRQARSASATFVPPASSASDKPPTRTSGTRHVIGHRAPDACVLGPDAPGPVMPYNIECPQCPAAHGLSALARLLAAGSPTGPSRRRTAETSSLTLWAAARRRRAGGRRTF